MLNTISFPRQHLLQSSQYIFSLHNALNSFGDKINMSSPFCICFNHFVSGADATFMSHMITAYLFQLDLYVSTVAFSFQERFVHQTSASVVQKMLGQWMFEVQSNEFVLNERIQSRCQTSMFFATWLLLNMLLVSSLYLMLTSLTLTTQMKMSLTKRNFLK